MKKILLIDDDYLSLQDQVEDLRKTYLYDVDWKLDASEVIEFVKTGNFNGIILDIMMPIPAEWSKDDQRSAKDGMLTGRVLFERIRAIHPTIPILIYSAKTGLSGNLLDSKSAYLRKPENVKTIVEQLKKLMKDEK